MAIRSVRHEGVLELIIDNPPVNALPVAGWFALAEALQQAGSDPSVRCVVLRAEGRGFQAGVDIKELAHADHGMLVDVNKGCFDAFAAVYDCPVPVIAAVHGYCIGGGIGLCGNADIILASDDATFSLPEVDRGALGAATHLQRLVPHHKARAMLYTCASATAAELHAFGSVWAVVPRESLRDAALKLAAEIAAKDPKVIRAAKAALGGIDRDDVKRSYRFEQGFTFEMTLVGSGQRAREEFAGASSKEPSEGKA